MLVSSAVSDAVLSSVVAVTGPPLVSAPPVLPPPPQSNGSLPSSQVPEPSGSSHTPSNCVGQMPPQSNGSVPSSQ
ncbi:MAG: hypothetical protein U0168_27010 [Nannocystaceae bacterium]